MKAFEPIFVCRDSFAIGRVRIFPARVGIVKLEGCHYFAAALKGDNGEYGYTCVEGQDHITLSACHRRYGSVPAKGEAWLVEEGRKHINWERVDHNMYLLEEDGTIIKENENE